MAGDNDILGKADALLRRHAAAPGDGPTPAAFRCSRTSSRTRPRTTAPSATRSRRKCSRA